MWEWLYAVPGYKYGGTKRLLFCFNIKQDGVEYNIIFVSGKLVYRTFINSSLSAKHFVVQGTHLKGTNFYYKQYFQKESRHLFRFSGISFHLHTLFPNGKKHILHTHTQGSMLELCLYSSRAQN